MVIPCEERERTFDRSRRRFMSHVPGLGMLRRQLHLWPRHGGQLAWRAAPSALAGLVITSGRPEIRTIRCPGRTSHCQPPPSRPGQTFDRKENGADATRCIFLLSCMTLCKRLRCLAGKPIQVRAPRRDRALVAWWTLWAPILCRGLNRATRKRWSTSLFHVRLRQLSSDGKDEVPLAFVVLTNYHTFHKAMAGVLFGLILTLPAFVLGEGNMRGLVRSHPVREMFLLTFWLLWWLRVHITHQHLVTLAGDQCLGSI